MAYGNNAVQLTIDSYLSRNIENENENENGNENEKNNENENKNKYNNENKNEKTKRKRKSSNEEEITKSENEFKEKRSAAYERWLDVPDTPYKKVNYFLFFFVQI